MVFTRSKARRQEAADAAQQVSSSSECEDPQPPKPAVKKRRKSAVHAKLILKPILPREESETTCEPTVEELALHALQVMKARLGVESPHVNDQHGMESENSKKHDVMKLETTKQQQQQRPPLPKRSGLATSLQPCMKEKPYFSLTTKGTLKSSSLSSTSRPALPWGESEEELMKNSVVTSDFEKKDIAPPMHVSKYAKAKARKVRFAQCVFLCVCCA